MLTQSGSEYVETPAVLQDSVTIDMPRAEAIRRIVAVADDVFGSGIREIEPGRLRLRKMGRVLDIVIEETPGRPSMTTVRVQTALHRTLLSKGLFAVMGLVTIAVWVVAALSMFADFHGQQTTARVALWAGSLACAAILSALTLRLATTHRVNINVALSRMDAFLLRVLQLEPGKRVQRGYRIAPTEVDEAAEAEALALEEAQPLRKVR